MQPSVDLNWVAIVVSVIVSFGIGSVWYGVLFREVWQRSMGYDATAAPDRSEMVRGSMLGIIGTVLTAVALAWLIGAWRPTAWGAAGPDGSGVVTGLIIGLLVWIGFVVPTGLNSVAYERSNWTRFAVGAAYQLVSLVAMALILALWR